MGNVQINEEYHKKDRKRNSKQVRVLKFKKCYFIFGGEMPTMPYCPLTSLITLMSIDMKSLILEEKLNII